MVTTANLFRPAPARLSATLSVLQSKRGAPRWTKEQHEQRAADFALISKQRSQLTEIDNDLDEDYFDRYLDEPKKYMTVYRGDGRGVDLNSWAVFVPAAINAKPGNPEISFYGVVAHTHSNSSPGGMVSTTSDMQGAIDWAVDTHNYGMVFEIVLYEYIDVNELLARRNFRNRYEGQHEYLIPRSIAKNEIRKVHLYRKNAAGPQHVETRSY